MKREVDTRKTTNPDFSGGTYYIERGVDFDRYDYAESFGFLLDQVQIAVIAREAETLRPGEWLEVTRRLGGEP